MAKDCKKYTPLSDLSHLVRYSNILAIINSLSPTSSRNKWIKISLELVDNTKNEPGFTVILKFDNELLNKFLDVATRGTIIEIEELEIVKNEGVVHGIVEDEEELRIIQDDLKFLKWYPKEKIHSVSDTLKPLLKNLLRLKKSIFADSPKILNLVEIDGARTTRSRENNQEASSSANHPLKRNRVKALSKSYDNFPKSRQLSSDTSDDQNESVTTATSKRPSRSLHSKRSDHNESKDMSSSSKLTSVAPKRCKSSSSISLERMLSKRISRGYQNKKENVVKRTSSRSSIKQNSEDTKSKQKLDDTVTSDEEILGKEKSHKSSTFKRTSSRSSLKQNLEDTKSKQKLDDTVTSDEEVLGKKKSHKSSTIKRTSSRSSLKQNLEDTKSKQKLDDTVTSDEEILGKEKSHKSSTFKRTSSRSSLKQNLEDTKSKQKLDDTVTSDEEVLGKKKSHKSSTFKRTSSRSSLKQNLEDTKSKQKLDDTVTSDEEVLGKKKSHKSSTFKRTSSRSSLKQNLEDTKSKQKLDDTVTSDEEVLGKKKSHKSSTIKRMSSRSSIKQNSDDTKSNQKLDNTAFNSDEEVLGKNTNINGTIVKRRSNRGSLNQNLEGNKSNQKLDDSAFTSKEKSKHSTSDIKRMSSRSSLNTSLESTNSEKKLDVDSSNSDEEILWINKNLNSSIIQRISSQGSLNQNLEGNKSNEKLDDSAFRSEETSKNSTSVIKRMSSRSSLNTSLEVTKSKQKLDDTDSKSREATLEKSKNNIVIKDKVNTSMLNKRKLNDSELSDSSDFAKRKKGNDSISPSNSDDSFVESVKGIIKNKSIVTNGSNVPIRRTRSTKSLLDYIGGKPRLQNKNLSGSLNNISSNQSTLRGNYRLHNPTLCSSDSSISSLNSSLTQSEKMPSKLNDEEKVTDCLKSSNAIKDKAELRTRSPAKTNYKIDSSAKYSSKEIIEEKLVTNKNVKSNKESPKRQNEKPTKNNEDNQNNKKMSQPGSDKNITKPIKQCDKALTATKSSKEKNNLDDKRVNEKRGRNSLNRNQQPANTPAKEDLLLSYLNPLTRHLHITEVKEMYEISLCDLDEIEVPDKFDMICKVVSEFTLIDEGIQVVRVQDGTLSVCHNLVIPERNSWTDIVNSIKKEPVVKMESPFIDIIIFDFTRMEYQIVPGKYFKLCNIMGIRLNMKDDPRKKTNKGELFFCVEGKSVNPKKLTVQEEIESKIQSESYKNALKMFLDVPNNEERETVKQGEEKSPLRNSTSTNLSDEQVLSSNSMDKEGDKNDEIMSSVTKKLPEKADKVLSNAKNHLNSSEETVVNETPAILRELSEIMHEESLLGLPFEPSEDIHLKNSGSEITFSEFARNADLKSKNFRTSTQDIPPIRLKERGKSEDSTKMDPLVYSPSESSVVGSPIKIKSLADINKTSGECSQSILQNYKPTESADVTSKQTKSLLSSRCKELCDKNGEMSDSSCVKLSSSDSSDLECEVVQQSRKRKLIDSDNNYRVKTKDTDCQILTPVQELPISSVNLSPKKTTELHDPQRISDGVVEDVEVLEVLSNVSSTGSYISINGTHPFSKPKKPSVSIPQAIQPSIVDESVGNSSQTIFTEERLKMIPARAFRKSTYKPKLLTTEQLNEIYNDNGGPVKYFSYSFDRHLPFINLDTFRRLSILGFIPTTARIISITPAVSSWKENCFKSRCPSCNKLFNVYNASNNIYLEDVTTEEAISVGSHIVCPDSNCSNKILDAPEYLFTLQLKVMEDHLITALIASKHAEELFGCSAKEAIKDEKKLEEMALLCEKINDHITTAQPIRLDLVRDDIFNPNSGNLYIQRFKF